MTTAPSVVPGGSWRRVLEGLSPVGVARRPSDWATDAVLFALCLVQWWVNGLPEVNPQIPDWFWPIDRTTGLIACCLVWWTRRYPLVCALLLLIPGSIAITAALPTMIGIYRLALLRRPPVSVLVTGLHIVCALPYHFVIPIPGLPWLGWIIIILLIYALALCLGLLGRARRLVIEGLRSTAARDRERYEQRLVDTRREEREGIAREMHDVLAHRISLLSVHAGALEYRAQSSTALSTEEVSEAASVIRENAHLAVEDLRELLGLLRTDGGVLGTARPQPTLDDVAGLAAEAAAAGQCVELVVDADSSQVRETVQRTAYRIVQESITNARKHAPDARVQVQVTGDGDGVRVLVDNLVPVGITNADISPGGSGLIGLAERVRLDGGTLASGIEAGHFRVLAELPNGDR
ncbi:MAG: histidine kinase [Propionibacteriaceae bacterium]